MLMGSQFPLFHYFLMDQNPFNLAWLLFLASILSHLCLMLQGDIGTCVPRGRWNVLQLLKTTCVVKVTKF